jgi:hypothetical protein
VDRPQPTPTGSWLSKEKIMKYEIFRADINKVLLSIEKPTEEEAFGAWASAAMLAGFLPMCNSAYDYKGGNIWEVTSSIGKKFNVEVRAA